MKFIVKSLVHALLFSIALGLSLASQADNVDKLSKRLIELRSDVDALSVELTLIRDEHKQFMSSLSRQKADAIAVLNRGQANLKRLQAELDKNKQKAAQAGSGESSIVPAVESSIGKLEGYIAQGLPFKVEERLQGLKEIRQQLNAGSLSPAKSANRVWAFVEDEILLTKENAIYKQRITLNGQVMLADVAKIGMVMMYFRTPEDEFGVLKNQNDTWSYQVELDAAKASQIEYLFDSLEKKIRTGYFELPSAL